MCKLAQQLCGTHQRLAKVTIRYCEPVREKYPTLGKSITFHVQNSLFWSPMDCCEGLLFGAATCADGFCPCVRWAEGSASFPDADGPIEAGGEDLDTPLDDSDDSPVMEAEEYETAYEHFAHDSGYETGSEFVPDDDGYENDTHFFADDEVFVANDGELFFGQGGADENDGDEEGTEVTLNLRGGAHDASTIYNAN